MKTWADLSDAVLAEVPGCSFALAASALRESAQVLCEKTKAWRVVLAPQVLTPGTDAYALALPAGTEAVRLVSAKLDGKDLRVLLEEVQGVQGILMTDVHNYRVIPMPAGSGSLVLSVVLEPSNDATGIDDLIDAKYRRAIQTGAKALLFGRRNQPFTDPAAAEAERMAFDDEIARIKIEVARAHSSAPLRVRPSFM